MTILERELPNLSAERQPPLVDANLLLMLWNRRSVLAQFLTKGLAVTIVIVFLIPNRYVSTARLMPPDNQSGAGLAALASLAGGVTSGSGSGGGSTLGALASDLLGTKNSSALFAGVLKSRSVQDRVIDRFRLRSVYGESKIEDARDRLADYTEIVEDRKSGILTINVTDKDPYRAQQMAGAYVDELDHLVGSVSTSAARRERVFIESRLSAVSRDLDTAVREFSEFSSKNATLDIKEQGKAMVEAAATLQGQLIAAESELAGLEQIYTANNVRVRSLRAKVQELRQQLRQVNGVDLVNGARASDELYPSVRELPLLGITYARLYRNMKVQEAVFEFLTRQYETAKIQEAKEIPTVKLLDEPVLPEKKASPPRLVLIVAGTLFSLALGISWLLGRALWERTEIDDPRRVFLSRIGQSAKVFLQAGVQRAWALQRTKFGNG